MHRSSSWTRAMATDDLPNLTAEQLPTYNPRSYVAKKEMSRIKSAESLVHLIPILLVICAVALWFFSTPSKTTI